MTAADTGPAAGDISLPIADLGRKFGVLYLQSNQLELAGIKAKQMGQNIEGIRAEHAEQQCTGLIDAVERAIAVAPATSFEDMLVQLLQCARINAAIGDLVEDRWIEERTRRADRMLLSIVQFVERTAELDRNDFGAASCILWPARLAEIVEPRPYVPETDG